MIHTGRSAIKLRLHFMMKKIQVVLLFMSLFIGAKAQLPDGSVASDFTALDSQGNTWNLYSLLDDGKIVLLNIFGAWDIYAWQYYQSGELQEFYAQFGPEGTNQVVVLNIEGQPNNGPDQLIGPALLSGDLTTQTQGDWLTGNPIPVIDNAGIADSLEVEYLPSVFMICPDKIISELSQVDSDQLATALNGLACPNITEGTDPALINLSAITVCGSNSAHISFFIKNVGTEPLTFAYITVFGVEAPFGHTWNGYLESYEQEEIIFDNVILIPNGNISVNITSADDNPSNNSAVISSGSVQTTLNIQVELGLDNWADEVSWEIRDANDNLVHSDGDFQISYQYFNTTYSLPFDGCYSFFLFDSNGDGLHGSQYGGFDGSCYVRGIDANGNPMATIYSYDGSYNFSNVIGTPAFQKAEFEALNSLDVNSSENSNGANLFPNPSNGIFKLNLSMTDLSKTRIDVVNLIGEIVYSFGADSIPIGTNSLDFDLAFLPDGLYNLRIQDSKSFTTTRLIIVH